MSDITISVRGKRGRGTSTIAKAIARALAGCGLRVEIQTLRSEQDDHENANLKRRGHLPTIKLPGVSKPEPRLIVVQDIGPYEES